MSVKMYNKLSNQSMSIEDKKREYLIKTYPERNVKIMKITSLIEFIIS